MGVNRRADAASKCRASVKRHKPLKRSTKPIRRVSKVRRTRLTKYAELRLAFLRERLYCEVCKTKVSTQVHHLAGRQGQKLTYFEHCIAVCFGCHRFIHDNPKWARENGFRTL